jgi:hypothetical protein
MTQVELPGLFTIAPFSDFDTSLEAAKAITEHLQRLEAIVLSVIRESGERGMCDHEVEETTGLIHQTASARRRGLVLKGLVEDSGIRRKTASGRHAKAWRVVEGKP